MTYKIEQIEGIGSYYAERLATSNIMTSDDLLARCGSDAGCHQVELLTGISGTQLRTWTHQADLMRVSGIGSEFGQLIESSGIESVKELAVRDPENIVNLLTRVNAEKRLTRALPSLKTVVKWVDRARQMEPMLTH